MTDYTKDALLELVHTPAHAAKEHIQWAESLKDAPGVIFGIPEMDRYLIPMHPGDMICLVGRPGHCKTSLLAYLAQHEAKRIAREKKNDKECVIYISWEQITEEIDSMFHISTEYNTTDIILGKINLETIRKNAISRVELPVWLIGDSISRTNTKSLRMTPDVIWQAVEKIIDEHERKPTLICGDYLQLVPVQRSRDLVQEITFAAGLLKELAKRCKCPLVLGVQARQEVDDYKVKLPRSRDGQWASRIFQACDKWFSLWRPWITDKGGGDLPFNGKSYEITENLIVIKKLKERFNEPVRTWALHFEPQWLRLGSIEPDIQSPTPF